MLFTNSPEWCMGWIAAYPGQDLAVVWEMPMSVFFHPAYISLWCYSVRFRMPGTMWIKHSSFSAAMMRATILRPALRSTRSVFCFPHAEILCYPVNWSSMFSLNASAHGCSDAPADASAKPSHDACLPDAAWAGNQWFDGTGQKTVNATQTLLGQIKFVWDV